MKTAFSYFGRLLLFVIAFLVLYVGLSFLLSYIPTSDKSAKGNGSRTIYLFSNGVHLDIVVPVGMVPTDLRQQLRPASSTELLAFGWGDKGFYLDTPTWAELRASVAVKAMFLPSPTAMHVTEHQQVHSTWSKAEISQEQLDQLFTYILSSFKTTASGEIIEIKDAGYTPQDRFYEAHGNYSCFKTCNTWVNKAMKVIGVKTAIWTPMDKGVLRYLEEVR
ncbi:TIGR02117 family protein [Neolewinella agarilytica]|uniref:TIGR02117 family protein n=1 Tax=Neolewinella agarilytica TaxID=478744 RepID=A0A1H9FK90_9BACT|nr:TIGR02117 family protein [Neolewinella agarilytica]SEQ38371.1 conserved hypothetical protein [Neolewinella agarilytica]